MTRLLRDLLKVVFSAVLTFFCFSLEDMEEQINDKKLLDSILPSWLPKHTYCMARYSKDNR